jgi:hypothetical protein
MRAKLRTVRAAPFGAALLTLAGCASLPVPRVLRPVFGGPARYTDTRICIVDRSAPTGLREAVVQKDEKRGTLYLNEGGDLHRLSATRARGYAKNERWFSRKSPIRQYARRYLPYGPRRVVPVSALTRGADHEGVPVFLDRRDVKQPDALYVPVEPGCVFQPYVPAGGSS